MTSTRKVKVENFTIIYQRVIYEGHPINRENFFIMQEFIPLNIVNIIISWHNWLGTQQHIQLFVGKGGHLLLIN